MLSPISHKTKQKKKKLCLTLPQIGQMGNKPIVNAIEKFAIEKTGTNHIKLVRIIRAIIVREHRVGSRGRHAIVRGCVVTIRIILNGTLAIIVIR